jgi:hypothetical protein
MGVKGVAYLGIAATAPDSAAAPGSVCRRAISSPAPARPTNPGVYCTIEQTHAAVRRGNRDIHRPVGRAVACLLSIRHGINPTSLCSACACLPDIRAAVAARARASVRRQER